MNLNKMKIYFVYVLVTFIRLRVYPKSIVITVLKNESMDWFILKEMELRFFNFYLAWID